MCNAFIENLKKHHYKVSCFPTAAEACQYLCGEIRDTVVGLGDSETLLRMGLAEGLAKCNTVIDPQPYSGKEFLEVARKAMNAKVFITSVNAAAETGELVNMDSTGNRVAGSLFGREKLYFVFYTNSQN